MQERNKYVNLEDQQPAQPKETWKHRELQTTMVEEVRLQTMFLWGKNIVAMMKFTRTTQFRQKWSLAYNFNFIKQEKEANESTGIDIQHEKQEDTTKQGEAVFKQ